MSNKYPAGRDCNTDTLLREMEQLRAEMRKLSVQLNALQATPIWFAPKEAAAYCRLKSTTGLRKAAARLGVPMPVPGGCWHRSVLDRIAPFSGKAWGLDGPRTVQVQQERPSKRTAPSECPSGRPKSAQEEVVESLARIREITYGNRKPRK